jgi:hypothetical protein
MIGASDWVARFARGDHDPEILDAFRRFADSVIDRLLAWLRADARVYELGARRLRLLAEAGIAHRVYGLEPEDEAVYATLPAADGARAERVLVVELAGTDLTTLVQANVVAAALSYAFQAKQVTWTRSPGGVTVRVPVASPLYDVLAAALRADPGPPADTSGT